VAFSYKYRVLSLVESARRRVADLLRSRRSGYWTVDEVAASQNIHRTVAFAHLEALVGAGLATKVSVKGRRGRPANAYRYSGKPVELSYPPQRTVLLAQVLARVVGGSPSIKAQARRLAREIGAKSGGLRRLEGDYEVDQTSVHARTCIFDSVCPSSRDVVCGLHAGLIEGALAAAGEGRDVTPEGPDGMGGCRFRLA
jgi:predicted ArsR family transcriptional regulator